MFDANIGKIDVYDQRETDTTSTDKSINMTVTAP